MRRVVTAEAWVAWRSAVIVNGLNAVISSLTLINFNEGLKFVVIRSMAVVFSMGVLGALFHQRRAPSLRFSYAAYVLVALPLYPAFWLISHDFPDGYIPEVYFRENISSIIFALATPPNAALSLLVIAGFSIESFVMYFQGVQSSMWSWQPWTNIIFTVTAACVALYRSKRLRREVELIVAEERSQALQQLLRVYLAVRDHVNTPLQTLQIAAHQLCVHHPDTVEVTDKIKRAASRLNDLNHTLEVETSKIDWKSEAFDALSILHEEANRHADPHSG